MNPEERQKLKEAISGEIENLKSDIISLVELTKPVAPDDAIGRLTRMEAINSKSINDASLSKAKSKLARLEDALIEIDDPDFGYCQVCDDPIPVKRLLLIPESTMCVKCAGNI